MTAVAEREALLAALRDQREHVLQAVSGLSDEALRQPVLPSGWTCLGLIQHLTDLEAPPAWWPTDVFADLPVRDLRRNILAVLVETACHAGHLDAVREVLDGHQHLVLT